MRPGVGLPRPNARRPLAPLLCGCRSVTPSDHWLQRASVRLTLTQNNATTTVATSHHTSNSSQAAPNGTGQTVPAGAASVPAAVNQNTTVHSTVTVHTTQTNSQAAHTAHFPVSNQVSTMNQIPAAPQVPTTIQVAAASHDPAAGTTTGPRRSHRHVSMTMASAKPMLTAYSGHPNRLTG